MIEAQRRASEALRLADDRLARAKGEAELKKERANRELAALRLQLSEAELTNVGIVLQGAQAEIQALELFDRGDPAPGHPRPGVADIAQRKMLTSSRQGCATH